MSVFVEVPVSYNVEAREFQKRLHEQTTFLIDLPVRIDEVDDGEAPVAIEAQTADGARWTYRTYRGGLVRNLVMPTRDGTAQVTSDNIAEVMGIFGDMVRNPGRPRVYPTWPFVRGIHRVEKYSSPDSWRETYNADPGPAIAAMRAVWAGACCVDGRVYVPSDGPAWVVGSTIMQGDQVGQDITTPEVYKSLHEYTGCTLPNGMTRHSGLKLVSERSHYFYNDRPDWVFAPDAQTLGAIKLAMAMHSLPHDIARSIKFANSTQALEHPVLAPQGRVWGPALRPEPVPGDVPVPEIELATRLMLDSSVRDLAHMTPQTILLYAELKMLHGRGVEDANAVRVLDVLQRFRVGRIADGLGNQHRLQADPVRPLLSYLELAGGLPNPRAGGLQGEPAEPEVEDVPGRAPGR